MKKKYLIICILIFVVILLGLGNINFVQAVTCYDLATDEYIENGFSSTLPFDSLTGQIGTDGSNLMDVYDYLVYGVDIEELKKKDSENGNTELKEAYIKQLEEVSVALENKNNAEASGAASGADTKTIAKWFASKYGGEYQTKYDAGEYKEVMDLAKSEVLKKADAVGATEGQKEEIGQSFDDIGNVSEAEGQNEIINAIAEGTENNKDKRKNDKIYKQPSIKTGTIKKDGTLQDMISDGDKFLNAGDENTIEAESLKGLSGRIYNILLEIGVGLSVIIGIILGIKFMLSGVEEKAEVKKMIWVYVVGCVVTFGSFGIWKLVVSILEQI